MERNSRPGDCDVTNPYVPGWQRKESPVEVIDSTLVNAELYENDGDVGVMLTGPTCLEFVKQNAAMIFGQSPEVLYFRADFSTVVKMVYDEDKRNTLERLYNAKVASVCICMGTFLKTEGGIPVFRDVGEVQLLARHEGPDVSGGALHASDMNAGRELQETTTDDFVIAEAVRHDDEIRAAVDEAVSKRDGKIVSRHENGARDRYSYDVAVVGQKCLVIMYFGLEGVWLAEEENPLADPPVWFSETDHTVSPVLFAQRWLASARDKVRQLHVIALVVVSGRSEIINEDEMDNIWKANCHVGVVRTKPVEGSGLPELNDYLDSLPDAIGPRTEADLETISEVNEDFMLKYWK